MARACGELDLAILQLLPFIDGERYMRVSWSFFKDMVTMEIKSFSHGQRIAEEAGMDIQQTERCLQYLHHCGVIDLVEAIQVGIMIGWDLNWFSFNDQLGEKKFSNIYVITEDAPKLMDPTSSLRNECLEYVRITGKIVVRSA